MDLLTSFLYPDGKGATAFVQRAAKDRKFPVSWSARHACLPGDDVERGEHVRAGIAARDVVDRD